MHAIVAAIKAVTADCSAYITMPLNRKPLTHLLK